MSLSLESFEIGRLFGHRTVSLALENNQLILVGENGSGKTTVINVIFYFLSRQWHRLVEIEFEWIRANLNGNEIYLDKRDLLLFAEDNEYRRRRYSRISPSMLNRLADAALFLDTADADIESVLTETARRHHVPRSLLVEYLQSGRGKQLNLLQDYSHKAELIKEFVSEEVLYLPTYRRIEQDLKSVLPDIDERIVRDRIHSRDIDSGYVELVEFGMHDVERDIDRMLERLREHSRRRLSELTNTFLREIIRGAYKDLTPATIEAVEDETLDSVFARVDTKTLPEHVRRRLRSLVEQVRSAESLETEEKIVAYFLLGLLEMNKSQLELEEDIKTFVDICNKYLVGKDFYYDGSNVTLEVRLDPIQKADDAALLKLQQMSSGEKQIVSLFSHLLLSPNNSFFILIDEPELSLSVPWQSRFLPDILNTRKCTGLIAVTHSPFIFENELDDYTFDLRTFWK